MKNKPSLLEFFVVSFWTISLLGSLVMLALQLIGVTNLPWLVVIAPATCSITLLCLEILLFVFCHDWIGTDPRD